MTSKTLVLKVQASPEVSATLERYSESCARWLGRSFRLLYSDHRHRGSSTYSTLIVPRMRKDGTPSGKFYTNDSAVYRLLVSKKDAPNPIPTSIAHRKNVQALATKLMTVWGGFIGPTKPRKVPRPHGHLPRFRPVCYVGQQIARLEPDGMSVSIPYPLLGREKGAAHRIGVSLVPSRDSKHKERLDLFRRTMRRAQKSGAPSTPSLELRRHDDGAWYIHVPVEDVRPQSKANGTLVGVDLGERNTATTAAINGEGKLLRVRLRSGLSTRHQLDMLSARRRKLRRLVDHGGGPSVEAALTRLRGKMARTNETLAQQASAAIVADAVADGASVIAVEDLRGGFRPLHKRGTVALEKKNGLRRWNHRLGRWNRGRVRDAITYKAQASGISVKEVFARGTSSLCPNCHPTGWLAEGEKRMGRRRRGDHSFRCPACGYSDNDDATGAINIAHRGLNPRRVSHNPTPASGVMGEGIAVREGSDGDTYQPRPGQPGQKARQDEGATTGNGAFVRPTENGTTGTEVTPARAGSASATSPGREAKGAQGNPGQESIATNENTADPASAEGMTASHRWPGSHGRLGSPTRPRCVASPDGPAAMEGCAACGSCYAELLVASPRPRWPGSHGRQITLPRYDNSGNPVASPRWPGSHEG